MILLNYDTHWEVTRVNWTHEPESSSTGDSLGGDYDMNCNTRIVKHHSIISTNFNTILGTTCWIMASIAIHYNF